EVRANRPAAPVPVPGVLARQDRGHCRVLRPAALQLRVPVVCRLHAGRGEYGVGDLEGHRWWFATPLTG
ncbi:MAG TPA: hypothetical protein VK217_02610, partial [Acidimicrobiales bacterium]|nr:hypothetical protein [Acidimicrobiales bacterium]